MIDIEPVIRRELGKAMSLPPEVQPNWADVRRRVRTEGAASSTGGDRVARLHLRGRRRRLLVLLAAVVVILAPITALGVANPPHWWFLGRAEQGIAPGFGPAKGAHVAVIKRGSWNGQGWVITAYRSKLDLLCIQLTWTVNGQPPPTNAGGAGSCGSQIGTTVTRPHQAAGKLTINYLSGSFFDGSRAKRVYAILGPVVGSATEVEILLSNGTTIRTPTFATPAALGMPIQFYATPLPSSAAPAGASCQQRTLAQTRVAPARLIGLDARGHVVATANLLPAAELKKLAVLRCNPPTQRLMSASAAASLKPIFHVTGPYGAQATALNGRIVPIRGAVMLPSGRLKKIVRPSRCWEITFRKGERQGGCSPLATPPYNRTLWFGIEHVGHDMFVLARTTNRAGAPTARVDFVLSTGKTLSAEPVDGIVVFAIPRDARDVTHSQRGFLFLYDANGKRLAYTNDLGAHLRQAVYYRSCPNADAIGGGGC